MIAIGRPINGISLNGLEYVINDDGNIMTFKSELEAKTFLREVVGLTDDDMYYMVFEEVNDILQ